MASKYDSDLQEIMRLIIDKSPRAEILVKAKDIKIEISRAWTDAQQAIAFLDQMINRYVPDAEYPQGFWVEPQPNLIRPGVAYSAPIRHSNVNPSIRPTMRIAFNIDHNHILEIAKKLTTNGTVKTKAIIRQLRTEGDPRPESTLLKSVGNILNRNNWVHVGTGEYKQPEEKENKDTQQALIQQ
jgi:hypothetical protein